MEWQQFFGVLAAGLFTCFAVLHGLFAAGNSAGRRVWGQDVDASHGEIRAASALIALVFVVVALFIVQTSGIFDIGLPRSREVFISSIVFWIAIETGVQLLRRRVAGWRARLLVGAMLLLLISLVVIE